MVGKIQLILQTIMVMPLFNSKHSLFNKSISLIPLYRTGNNTITMYSATCTFWMILGTLSSAVCYHQGLFTNFHSSHSTALCTKRYINSLADCPDELKCKDDTNCSSDDVCCPNSCGTGTCMPPYIVGDLPDDQRQCENVTCIGQGRQCVVYNERTWCICERSCQDVSTNDELVCDQNGTTYLSMCLLNKRACETRRELIPSRCPYLEGNAVDNAIDSAEPYFTTIAHGQVAVEGSNVRLICRPNGNPIPMIHWQTPKGRLLEVGQSSHMDDGRISVDGTGTLIITGVTLGDDGEYFCIATSRLGEAIRRYRLQVQESRNTVRRSSTVLQVDCNNYPARQAQRCRRKRTLPIKWMWVYDKGSNTCNTSFFRDCYAVTNKFATKSKCENACVKDVCALPAERGSCNDFRVRTAYNAALGHCVPFVYGGCEGNLNNFRDMAQCNLTCGKGPHRGSVPTPPCKNCKPNEGRAVCSADFVIVANIKHLPRKANFDDGFPIMHVEITEILADWSINLNLSRRNLLNLQEARMDIKVELDQECPCPKMYDLRSGGNRGRFSRRRLSGRSSDVSAIIAGKEVDGFPTLTEDGLAQKKTSSGYKRVSESIIKSEFMCNALASMNRQG